MNVNNLLGLMIGFALVAAGGWADDFAQESGKNWSQWRGPTFNGVALAGNPVTEWSETKNVRWKVALPGHGNSSPVVWGDKIFVQAALPTGEKIQLTAAQQTQARRPRRGPHGASTPTEVYKFDLICLDRKTGAIVWESTAAETTPHEGHHPDHGWASYSPTTDGERVYASFGSRGVFAYDMDGNQLWKRELGQMRTKLTFGEAASPTLIGDRLIVLWDHEGDSFITALDKLTGKTIWKTDRKETTTWSTPIIVEHEGTSQIIVQATPVVRSYDSATGEQIWEAGGQTSNAIPSPVHGFGMVFATSGFRGKALHAIELGNSGALTGGDAIRWTADKGTPYVPSPLLYGDKLYVLNGNSGILTCFDAETGEAHYEQQRLKGLAGVYSSPVGGGQHVYIIGRDGGGVVIKNSETLEVVSTNKLDDHFDASIAIVGDEMFLRGKANIYCIAAD